MPIEVNGKIYKTIEEAAAELGVHAKSLRAYIRDGILSEPPAVPTGLVERRYFPDKLIEEYKKTLQAAREARRKK
jgi:DNA-binding transcriptional MerR regulator